ncbi:MAG TPA: LLM class flavin-dependent oxidoreductase [Candidatus Dormibacteraeota bacterium]|jgi:alkanesulfonate monooxygenase SsuD/methylene tetrahydromethanopterin reductase-like flavin-dependent oxidoreductase (luciferase family)|nr:LLM class flavin-dependent oxidoreductase [Candidatus Dormibacteraeota bacterium]
MPSAFAAGSISLGLHTHEATLDRMVSSLREQARAAETAGFDGVTLSEHHAGFPGYVPNPLQWSAILLGELDHAWAAPCPTLLPLRPAAGLVEDLAWLAAAFPGRVGAGFAVGYHEQDFSVMDSDFSTRAQRHWAALPGVVAALTGHAGGALGADPAVAALAAAPVPVVSGAGGPVGARRAAAAGAGLLITSLTDAQHARELVDAYRRAGGRGPCMLIRRVWVGRPPGTLEAQVAQYQRAGSNPSWLLQTGEDPLLSGEPDGIVRRVDADLRESGADALNIRVHLPRAAPEQVLEQIAGLGREVLQPLRAGGAMPRQEPVAHRAPPL